MVYNADQDIGDWTDETQKTCPTAFCTYPEGCCAFEDINVGAVDALDFVWLEGAEKCLKTQEEDDHELLSEDDDPRPDQMYPIIWSFTMVGLKCPAPLCTYQDMGFETSEEDMVRAFNEHWNDQHG